MDDPNRLILEAATRVLEPMLDEVVFIGGCATGLLITDPAAKKVRPTTDVEIATKRVRSYSRTPGALRFTAVTEQQPPSPKWLVPL